MKSNVNKLRRHIQSLFFDMRGNYEVLFVDISRVDCLSEDV